MSHPSPEAASVRRGRRTLIALFLLFIGPILVGWSLGWLILHTSEIDSKGELLSPKPDLRGFALARADGTAYAWEPERRLWRIALAPPPGWCQAHAAECAKLAQDVDKVWQLFGKDADHAQVLWFGAMPAQAPGSPAWQPMREDAKLSAPLPRTQVPAAGVPPSVTDPSGLVVLRYAPGFDPVDLRSDMAKLLKLM